MNTVAKGDKLAHHVKNEALERGLPVVKVRSSGHMGHRGGVPADVVVCDIPIECKNYKRGLSTKAVADILAEGDAQAVVHKCARGRVVVTMDLGDWLDGLRQPPLVAAALREVTTMIRCFELDLSCSIGATNVSQVKDALRKAGACSGSAWCGDCQNVVCRPELATEGSE